MRTITSNDVCSIIPQLGLGPVGTPMGDNVPFDVIMYNEEGEVMEATIANIAVEMENPESGALEWITPPLSSGTSAHFFFTSVVMDLSVYACAILIFLITLYFTFRIVERNNAPQIAGDWTAERTSDHCVRTQESCRGMSKGLFWSSRFFFSIGAYMGVCPELINFELAY